MNNEMTCKSCGPTLTALLWDARQLLFSKDTIFMSDITIHDKILVERSGPVGRIVINNEAKRNAMSLDMWQAIPDAIKALDDDAEIHVIVIIGAGDVAFISGADVTEFDVVRKDTASATRYDDITADCYGSVRNAKKPTIALIKGFCMGAGLGLAAACDLRLSNESGKFGIPAGRLGVGYPAKAIADIVNIVGPAKAKELYLTAKVLDAAQADAMGLLNEIYADEEFAEKSEKYCLNIARLAPLSAQYHKAAINAAFGQLDHLSIEALRAMATACLDSDDYAEGLRAFAEKRKPVFVGK